MTKSEARGYLAGLIDGEGYVYFADNPKAEGKPRKTHRILNISNTDVDIITAGVEACEILGIKARVDRVKQRGFGKLSVYRLLVYDRRSFEIIRSLPLRSAKKIDTLNDILASYSTFDYRRFRSQGARILMETTEAI